MSHPGPRAELCRWCGEPKRLDELCPRCGKTGDDDLCDYGDCLNQATRTEYWYDEEQVEVRVCDEHEGD